MKFHTKVVGVTFEDRQRAIWSLKRQGYLEEGSPLILVREPHNVHDRNAVAVKAQNGQQIGYLSREVAEKVVGSMDRGIVHTATVASVTGGDVGNAYGVNICIEY